MFVTPVTLQDIQRAHEAIASLCAGIEPDVMGDHDVPAAFDLLVQMQKSVSGAVLRMSARYEQTNAWKRNGARSPEDDLARKPGTSTGQAKRALKTSRQLGKLSKVDDATKNGDLSPEQAAQVADGAEASPEDEDALLRAAEKESMQALRRRAAEARAKADRDRDARRARQHDARRISRWYDDDGMYNLLLKAPAEWGAEIDAALKPDIDRAFADARHAGRFESADAYGADVVRRLLVDRSAGDRPPSGRSQAVRPEKKVIGIIDVGALNRGYTVGDETSVIAGVGPVSVSAIRALLADAFVSIVFTDGVDILNVTHLGREVTAHQRTALELRGYECEMDECSCTMGLDIDHVTGFTLTKKTELDDLAWLCRHHHDRKTRERLRLVGPVGRRRYAPAEPGEHDPPEGVAIQDDLFTTAR